MRYFNKAEREREQKRESERAKRRRWMTIVEAIKYINDKEQLGDHEALEDLFHAIVDGKVKALSGDVSYEEEFISRYRQLSPDELQGELKICLDGPGYINLDSLSPRAKKPRADIIEYPKISIVPGRIGKVIFDKADPYSPVAIPEVDDLEYGPVLVSRDDMQKWPFGPEEEPHQVSSAPTQFPITLHKAHNEQNTPLASSADHVTKKARLRHRRSATIQAILSLWPPNGASPDGIMVRDRDEAINKWLKEHGRRPVSPKTISRAFAELARDRS